MSVFTFITRIGSRMTTVLQLLQIEVPVRALLSGLFPLMGRYDGDLPCSHFGVQRDDHPLRDLQSHSKRRDRQWLEFRLLTGCLISPRNIVSGFIQSTYKSHDFESMFSDITAYRTAQPLRIRSSLEDKMACIGLLKTKSFWSPGDSWLISYEDRRPRFGVSMSRDHVYRRGNQPGSRAAHLRIPDINCQGPLEVYAHRSYRNRPPA